DWNHWQMSGGPKTLEEITAVTGGKPIWVSEAGVSSFGAEEVQAFGLKRTAELLLPITERIHWYSLYDLPAAWPATTRHKEAEGSAYYRHYYMGLLREDGTPKIAAGSFPEGLGICQWFHFEDFAAWAVTQYAAPGKSREKNPFSAEQLKYSFKESSVPKVSEPV